MIYLDNNATTPPAEPVIAVLSETFQSAWGNPSSAHFQGRSARRVVEHAREQVAGLLGASGTDEIVFTSGGTESDNWAILGTLANRAASEIIISTVEHEAVLKAANWAEEIGNRVHRVEVDAEGELDLDALKNFLSADTAIVSVMLANNETGVIFPVERMAGIVKEHSDALVHVDGVNAAGKIPIDLSSSKIDLFSISAHKFHGPKGVGALYVKKGIDLPPFLRGGGQESGRRAGTEAVHQIAALGAAAEFAADLSSMDRVRSLRDRLECELLRTIPKAFLNGTSDPAKRLPNTSNISFEGVNGEMILSSLDDVGICVSTGSACNAGSKNVSHVLKAMNVPFSRAMGSIRFSLSRMNTSEEIDEVIRKLPPIVEVLTPQI